MALRPKFLLRIEFPDWVDVYKGLLAAETVTKNEAREATRDIGRLLVMHMKREAPIGFKYDEGGIPHMSGSLRASIRFRTYERESFGRGVGIGFGEYNPAVEGGTLLHLTMADYGRYTLPPGTKPHMIFPRKGRFLAFYWTKPQKMMFLKSVEHPGYKGDPWDMRAFENARVELEDRWAGVAESWRVYARRPGTYYNR